tara:strand:+ start:614 stop:1531 length:918 start_codon:yes stop_codon:yes gene_type:complete
MADDYVTSAKIIEFNDSNLEFDVSDVLNDAPVLANLSAFSVDGTQLKYMRQDTDPVVGFRTLNAGVDNDVSTWTQKTVSLAIADGSFNIDIAAAEGYRLGPAAFIAMQMRNHMKALMFKIEDELINGDNTDGFSSLADELDALADTTVIGAGGTTADTGSSCYLIRTGFNDVQVAWGQQGVIEAKDTTIVRTADSSSKHFPSYFTAVTGYVGLIYGSSYSAGRICNLTEDSGKGLTDDLISQALSKFPASRPPNMLAMNRRSLQQLQASRTATNATGAPSPFPSEAFGIPIVVTDAISSTEALVS